MYNLREACKHAGTITKSLEHGRDLALRPKNLMLHHNHASAPSILMCNGACICIDLHIFAQMQHPLKHANNHINTANIYIYISIWFIYIFSRPNVYIYMVCIYAYIAIYTLMHKLCCIYIYTYIYIYIYVCVFIYVYSVRPISLCASPLVLQEATVSII